MFFKCDLEIVGYKKSENITSNFSKASCDVGFVKTFFFKHSCKISQAILFSTYNIYVYVPQLMATN